MTKRKRALKSDLVKSDLAKIDRHRIGAAEYAELPEWTDAMFEAADFHRDGRLVRRGRPPKEHPKVSTTLRLDAEVLDFFRAQGPGWQTRINQALRKAAKLKTARA
ncbi:MAG: BrnA antitoxin family protein [Rhodospirillales bacterium]|nr:BrnA antitoxin family protein [Rhodospirillales bacterium]